MGLHGSMHQLRRMAVYDEFCQKKNAVLIATDVAARGLGEEPFMLVFCFIYHPEAQIYTTWKPLSSFARCYRAFLSPDIPAVDWVVQVDCPEDVTTYIHRVGRTARYSKSGEAILLLTPSEEPAMLDCLKAKNIPIEKIEWVIPLCWYCCHR